jgi:hypothetical protein
MRFEFPPIQDHAAQRAILGSLAINSKLDLIASTAVDILSQIGIDQIVAAKRVDQTLNSMVLRGALKSVGEGVVVHFEDLTLENRARIRWKQFSWDWKWDNGCELPDIAPATEKHEPCLPVASFKPGIQDVLHHCLRNELIPSLVRDGEPVVSESNYLACLPTLVALLLADHAEAPTLVVRDGAVCAPWENVNLYTSPDALYSSWEFGLQDIPNPADSSAKTQSHLRSE